MNRFKESEYILLYFKSHFKFELRMRFKGVFYCRGMNFARFLKRCIKETNNIFTIDFFIICLLIFYYYLKKLLKKKKLKFTKL